MLREEINTPLSQLRAFYGVRYSTVPLSLFTNTQNRLVAWLDNVGTNLKCACFHVYGAVCCYAGVESEVREAVAPTYGFIYLPLLPTVLYRYCTVRIRFPVSVHGLQS